MSRSIQIEVTLDDVETTDSQALAEFHAVQLARQFGVRAVKVQILSGEGAWLADAYRRL